MGGLGLIVVIGGAVGAAMYFTTAKQKPSGAAFTDVSENLVNGNTFVVNSSQMTGGSPTRPLPADAVLTPSWKAAEEAKAAAQGGTSGVTKAPTTMVPVADKAPAETKKDDTKDWLQANPGTAAICYPKNGYEVVMMVNGSASPCRVIVLTKPFTYGYKIEKQINVTMPKVCSVEGRESREGGGGCAFSVPIFHHASKLPHFLDLPSLLCSLPSFPPSPPHLGHHRQSLGYANVELLQEDRALL